jgi:hypothetical protein
MTHPGDLSELDRLIAGGTVRAADVVAIIGKTEGNGGVNDFTRGYFTQTLMLLLSKYLNRPAEQLIREIPCVLSGGTEGVMSPHYSVFCISETAPAREAGSSLAIGTAFSDPVPAEDVGRRAHVDSVANAVRAAIANAGIGLLVFIADDRQLRDITFWMLGSMSGATWGKIATLAPVLAVALIACLSIARGLDVLVLGEAGAFHSGVDVERLKRISIILVSAMTGVAVSVCGVVGFVGIVVPHLLRLVIGPAHRLLLPASVLLGAVLLVGADTMARTIVSPAEMPIGVLTAAVGAPFFLAILLRQRSLVSL